MKTSTPSQSASGSKTRLSHSNKLRQSRTAVFVRLGSSLFGASLFLTACGGGDSSPTPNPTDAVLASIQSRPTVKELPFDSPVPARCPTTSHPFNTMLCSIGSATNPDGSLNYNSDGTMPFDLKAMGYTEKEFLQSGTANVYDLDATTERAVVRSANNPYATRLLVRFPSDPSKFSGRVYVEIYNATNNYDVENTWRRAGEYFISKGDAFIGITSKNNNANALKKFDAVRYADINWQVNGVDENGLFWDMLSQLATELRQPSAGGILGNLQPTHVYLTGESQSALFMNTYLTAFSDRIEKAGPNGASLFDGYLNGVGAGFTGLRSETTRPFVSTPTKLFEPTRVPNIVYISENESSTAPNVRRIDANLDTDKFRFYEYPGTPHSDPVSKVLPINSEIIKAGGNPRSAKVYYLDPTTGIQQEHDDLQLTEFFHAMQETLHTWAVSGTPAPSASAKWMTYSTTIGASGVTQYAVVRDSNGNALGGVRSPLISVPLYRFYGQIQTGPTTYAAYDAGSMAKLPDATVNTLYGGKCSKFLTQFNTAANAAVTSLALVKSDSDRLKAWAITKGNLVVWDDGNACN